MSLDVVYDCLIRATVITVRIRLRRVMVALGSASSSTSTTRSNPKATENHHPPRRDSAFRDDPRPLKKGHKNKHKGVGDWGERPPGVGGHRPRPAEDGRLPRQGLSDRDLSEPDEARVALWSISFSSNGHFRTATNRWAADV